jgi:hypothetical protein
MGTAQRKTALTGAAGTARTQYSAFINSIKSMSIIERLYWLVILFCLIGACYE